MKSANASYNFEPYKALEIRHVILLQTALCKPIFPLNVLVDAKVHGIYLLKAASQIVQDENSGQTSRSPKERTQLTEKMQYNQTPLLERHETNAFFSSLTDRIGY